MGQNAFGNWSKKAPGASWLTGWLKFPSRCYRRLMKLPNKNQSQKQNLQMDGKWRKLPGELLPQIPSGITCSDGWVCAPKASEPVQGCRKADWAVPDGQPLRSGFVRELVGDLKTAMIPAVRLWTYHTGTSHSPYYPKNKSRETHYQGKGGEAVGHEENTWESTGDQIYWKLALYSDQHFQAR